MLRTHAPLVGLATNTEAIAAPHDPNSPYDARIMHRAVPANLTTLTVVPDASDNQLAAALGLTPERVRTTMLTSRTPITDPRASAANTTLNSSTARYRPNTMVPISLLQRYRDMAVQLRARLEALEPPRRSKDQYYATTTTNTKQPLSIGGSSSSDDHFGSSIGSFEPTSIIPLQAQHRQSATCGLSKRGRYVGTVNNKTVVRREGGLYSGARHSRLVHRGESCYVEFDIEYAGGQGGIAVGAATQAHNIDRMVGLANGSMAIHSDAKFVCAGKWSDANVMPFGTGDTVGLFVSVGMNGVVHMRVYVNAEFVGELQGDEEMRNNVMEGKGVQVLVSLLRPGARVSMKCCPGEWRMFPFEDRDRVAASLCVKGRIAERKRRAVEDDRTSAVLTP